MLDFRVQDTGLTDAGYWTLGCWINGLKDAGYWILGCRILDFRMDAGYWT
jgi:hypothetical protein